MLAPCWPGGSTRGGPWTPPTGGAARGSGDLGLRISSCGAASSRSLQQSLRVGQLHALVEAQVYVVLMEGDVAEVFAHLLRADTVARHVLSRPWCLHDLGVDVDDEAPGA